MDKTSLKNWFLGKSWIYEIYDEAKLCLALTLPLSLAQLIEISMLTVDTWTMGMLGSQVLAGGALGYATYRFLSLIGSYTISGVNAVAASAFGGRQLEKIDCIMTQGFYLSLLLSVPLMLVLGTSSQWMVFLGQEKANILMSQSYSQAVVWGLPALFGYEVLRNVLIAINEPKVITVIATVSVFINGIFNYILAFGELGFPALGLMGIGLATVIVLWFQLFIILVYIFFNRKFEVYNFLRQSAKFDWLVFQEIIAIGWSIGARFSLFGSYQILLVYLFGYIGSVPLAAFQIVNQVDMLIRHVMYGLAQSITSRVGQMYGKQDVLGIRRSGFTGIALGVILTVLMLIIVAMLRTPIISFFLTQKTPTDFEVFQLAQVFLLVVIVLQVINEIDTTVNACLIGIKDVVAPVIIYLVGLWGLGLSITYLLVILLNLGGIGLLVSYYLSGLTPAISLFVRFYLRSRTMCFDDLTNSAPVNEP